MSMQANDNNGGRANSGHRQSGNETDQTAAQKSDYQSPRILSIEPLEVAAAVCDPPTGGLGKAGPPVCGTLGS